MFSWKSGLFLLFVCIQCLSLSADERQSPQLAVTGQAILKRPADEATLTLGVSTEAINANDALVDNSTKMRQIIEVLKEAGLKKGEYETGQFSLDTLYTSRPPHAPDDWSPKIRGYKVDNRIIIRTQQMDNLGNLIDVAVKKGANAIGNISFGLHDFRAYSTKIQRQVK